MQPAKSEPEWNGWVETKGWGAAMHEVRWIDDVARVAVTVTAPGKAGMPGPKHQRPAWIGYFKRPKKTEPWTVGLFAPAQAKEQKAAEANVSSLDAKVQATDQHKKLVLALRMEDVRMIPPTRTALTPHEAALVLAQGAHRLARWTRRRKAGSSPTAPTSRRWCARRRW